MIDSGKNTVKEIRKYYGDYHDEITRQYYQLGVMSKADFEAAHLQNNLDLDAEIDRKGLKPPVVKSRLELLEDRVAALEGAP